MNWYTYAANNPLIYIDPNGLKAILEAHGLYSRGETWKDMNEYLENRGGFEIGGIIGGDEFVNKNLFSEEEWGEIQKEADELQKKNKNNSNARKEYISKKVQAKVAELDEQGTDVLFMMNFSNNQDNFRKQGVELKKAVDLVKPKGQKVDVLAHSMGSLAAASYIAGISGVDYGYDIDKFLAIGAPFRGSSLAYGADALGDILPGNLRRSGDAYSNLRPDSKAINDLQTAWNNKFGSLAAPFGVEFYSLQSRPGDGVVSWASSTSLAGSIDIDMPFVLHMNQRKNIHYQRQACSILTGNSILHERPGKIPEPFLPW